MTEARPKDDGLWTTGLARRVEDTEPPCVGCAEKPSERELTLLWRRTTAFRRRRMSSRR